ncbi:DUF1778 domain-containing protein [Thiomicrorhabdus sp. 6S2-11]|uniref:DUF1778 domain-containing protein n=1 Tax=Thiomicrorhabdus marina TaxID=2818442 RepID=A0ABS3Q7Y7_9GAMM|nr:DUF1778 domain-containing protein [Thiomicrorhabdus marina]MBO1928453.1 DUF1778 domain-containing protein [Thiomicrorhabdus marina]
MMQKLPINMRVLPEQKALISQAAAILKMDRTAFILNTVCREAEEVLLNQRVFLLDDKAFDQFEQVLEKPLPNSAELEKLLSEKSPWE